MSKRGENIYKRKDGRWEGRYKNGFKPDGRTKYSSVYGKSYGEVRVKLDEKRSYNRETFSKCSLMFGELADLWIDSIKNTVKESTYSNYMMKLEKHIFPALGSIKYEKLTVKFLNKFLSDKISGGLSTKYVFDIGSLIKSVTRFARRKLGFEDKAELLSLPKREIRPERPLLSSSQQNKLVSSLLNSTNPSDVGILLSVATGIRIGELCALKWSDIDLKKRIITVNKTIQRIKNYSGNTATKIVITPPKSKTSEREIPIQDFMIPILKRVKSGDDCYLLTGKILFAEPRTMQYRFKSLLKRLELPTINFHILRHMFATKCISVGFDVKTLSEILGHSSVEITLNRYVHSSFERKRHCFKLLSKNLKPSAFSSL